MKTSEVMKGKAVETMPVVAERLTDLVAGDMTLDQQERYLRCAVNIKMTEIEAVIRKAVDQHKAVLDQISKNIDSVDARLEKAKQGQVEKIKRRVNVKTLAGRLTAFLEKSIGNGAKLEKRELRLDVSARDSQSSFVAILRAAFSHALVVLCEWNEPYSENIVELMARKDDLLQLRSQQESRLYDTMQRLQDTSWQRRQVESRVSMIMLEKHADGRQFLDVLKGVDVGLQLPKAVEL